MKTIKKAVAEMLKENTGTYMLDSGSAYGRHWQKNQIKQFDKEDPIFWDKYGITKNIYHYLIDNLKIDQDSIKYQKMYNNFVKNSQDYYLTDMKNFIDYLKDQDLIKSDNYLIGDDPQAINTYNYDNLLSQVIQYIVFYDGSDYYIILQLHNGCDVRGGYTQPKIFKINDYEHFILDQQDCNIKTNRAFYYTDDSYHFYFEQLVNNDSDQIKFFKDSLIKDNKIYTYEDLYNEGIIEIF